MIVKDIQYFARYECTRCGKKKVEEIGYDRYLECAYSNRFYK